MSGACNAAQFTAHNIHGRRLGAPASEALLVEGPSGIVTGGGEAGVLGRPVYLFVCFSFSTVGRQKSIIARVLLLVPTPRYVWGEGV